MKSGPISERPVFASSPDAGVGVVFPIETAAGRQRIAIRGDHVTVAAAGDVQLAAGLFAAMRRGEDLRIIDPVSARLLAQSDRLQQVLCAWDTALLRPGRTERRFRRIAVAAPADDGVYGAVGDDDMSGRGVAAFFTGGVDSFFTAVRHRGELDALVFVHGFDVPLADRGLRAAVSARLRSAAMMIGVPLLEVVTDLRKVSSRNGLSWSEAHGGALAAVGHALAARFRRFYIPATATYGNLYPLGSHPVLDPLWSSDRVEFIHDGAHATRADKMRILAEEPAARKHLRVCFVNRDDAYNCGSCEKCVRTAATAQVALGRSPFETLPEVTPGRVARARATGLATSWRELRRVARRSGADARMRWSIEAVLLRHRVQMQIRSMRARWRG